MMFESYMDEQQSLTCHRLQETTVNTYSLQKLRQKQGLSLTPTLLCFSCSSEKNMHQSLWEDNI